MTLALSMVIIVQLTLIEIADDKSILSGPKIFLVQTWLSVIEYQQLTIKAFVIQVSQALPKNLSRWSAVCMTMDNRCLKDLTAGISIPPHNIDRLNQFFPRKFSFDQLARISR